jgi:hypothetical protein
MVSLGGCATVHHGTSQTIPIVSNPAGASVFIDGVRVGVTPLFASVSRKQNHLVTVGGDSLPSLSTPLEHHVSLWTFGNWALAILPAAVDFANGAAYTFSVDTVSAVFPGAAQPGSIMLQHIRIDGEARTAAVIASAIEGFGVGHHMIDAGDAGRPFRNTQIAAATAGFIGLGMGMSNNNTTSGIGVPLFFAGVGVFVVSRVWEVADVISRTGH